MRSKPSRDQTANDDETETTQTSEEETMDELHIKNWQASQKTISSYHWFP
jgi:hypothetical protein